jgi:hypothetical protein
MPVPKLWEFPSRPKPCLPGHLLPGLDTFESPSGSACLCQPPLPSCPPEARCGSVAYSIACLPSSWAFPTSPRIQYLH